MLPLPVAARGDAVPGKRDGRANGVAVEVVVSRRDRAAGCSASAVIETLPMGFGGRIKNNKRSVV